MTDADIRFYFDPVCPFAWITSTWVRMVAAQRDYAFDWRFISLRMINSQVDDGFGVQVPGGAHMMTWGFTTPGHFFMRCGDDLSQPGGELGGWRSPLKLY